MKKAYQHRKPTVQYRDGIPIIRVFKPGTSEVIVVERKLARYREKDCKHELAELVYQGGTNGYKKGCVLCGGIFK